MVRILPFCIFDNPMKRFLICLIVYLLCASPTYADYGRLYHLFKTRITTKDSVFTTYAVIVGEIGHLSDSSLQAYKKNPELFKELINFRMLRTPADTIDLYAQIIRVQHDEARIALLPQDTHSKISWKQVIEITLLQYVDADYTYKMIYSDVMSTDAGWLTWKIAKTEKFGDSNCFYTALIFNKPDDNTRQVIDRARKLFARLYHEETSAEEIEHMRRLLRKARIVVYGMCTC